MENLDNGAVENWLLRMLKAGKTFGEPLDWTFFCLLPHPGRFDGYARGLGASVIHSSVALGSTAAFVRNLRRIVKEGRYDIVHCHHDIVSAVYLLAIVGLPIRRRIVHVHNADMSVPTGSRRKARLLREPMRRICLRLADRIVGISRHTLLHFLGGRAPARPRDAVLYYGVDTGPFHRARPDKSRLLTALQLPANARIALFAGRLTDYKNPLFVIDILAKLASTDATIFAVFAGTGPLETDIRQRATARSVGDRVRLLGWRDDTAELMCAADVFIFPRLEEASPEVGLEGLGLAVIEAQAAGLPMLLSRGIPEDAIVNPALCEFATLALGAAGWADRVSAILDRPRVDARSAVDAIDRSCFSLHEGFVNLMSLHAL